MSNDRLFGILFGLVLCVIGIKFTLDGYKDRGGVPYYHSSFYSGIFMVIMSIIIFIIILFTKPIYDSELSLETTVKQLRYVTTVRYNSREDSSQVEIYDKKLDKRSRFMIKGSVYIADDTTLLE